MGNAYKRFVLSLFFMTGFFKDLGKAVKKLDKIAKELEPEKKTSKEIPKEETAPSEGRDLRPILPVAEVVRITNLPIDTYTPYFDDAWEGGVYTSSDPKIHTYFQAWFARKDIDGYNPDGVLSYPKEVMPNLQPIKGIGDEAYWSDINATLLIRKEQDVLQAVTTSDRGLSLKIMQQLVKIIISKV